MNTNRIKKSQKLNDLMGNCCNFLKRSSRYENDEKVDQIGYRKSSSTSKPPVIFNDIGSSQKNANGGNLTNSNNNNFNNSGAPTNGSNNLGQGISPENRSEDGNLSIPHIADFYPEVENSTVPADNPRMSTLFLPKATIEKRKKAPPPSNETNSFINSSQTNLNTLKKLSNSCSTIYVDDSTVSQPNLKSVIRLVACAIHYHIKRRTSDRSIEIFDEKIFPISTDAKVPVDYDKIVPEHRAIYKFMKNLFTSAQLTSECAIVTLIYLERVLTYAEIDLCPANWKRLLLGSILLASKVWDDQAVWNVDYCQILKDMNVDNMNELERQYLVLMQFNINVPSSVYAKYYFDLRKLDEDNNSSPLEPLTKEKAIKLEAMSSVNQDKCKDYMQYHIKHIRRTASVNNLSSPTRKSLVILS